MGMGLWAWSLLSGCLRPYRGISEIGEVMCLGRSAPDGSLAVLFFVRVNQVLVRLWARVIGVGPFGLMVVPSFGCMSDRESCPSG